MAGETQAPSITGNPDLDAILAAQSAQASQADPLQARQPTMDEMIQASTPPERRVNPLAGAADFSAAAADPQHDPSLGAAPPNLPPPAVPSAAPGAAPPPSPLSPGPLTLNGQTAATFQGPDLRGINAQLQGAQAREERGITGQAGAQAQAAKESAAALEQANRVQQEHAQASQDEFKNLVKEHDAISADVQNSHIDPQRLWANKSSGQKATAIIGMILGGIGSGMTGQPNAALAVIQKQIEQDIDAQKAEIGKKENLLADNHRKVGNWQAAEQMTRLQMTAALEGQLKLAAARSGSADAMAKADALIGASRKALIPHYLQLAQTQAAYSLMQGAGSQPQGYLPSRAAPPTGTDPTNPLKYVMEARKDASERTLIGPGGKQFLAYDKETAGKVRPMLQAAQNAAAVLREMDGLRRNASGMPGTDAANLYAKYRSALAEQWAMANGLTQPSETMNKNLEHVMPSSWDAFVRGKVAFEPIVKLLHDRTNGIYESAGLHPDALPILQLPVR